MQLFRHETLALQALISGRVIDADTDHAPVTAVLLHLREDGASADFPLPLRQLDDGTFAYYGDPLAVFTDKAKTYTLRLTAAASGYDPAEAAFNVGPLGAQPEPVTVTPPDPEIGALTVRLYRAGGLPRKGILLTLQRQPVTLAGMVVSADDGATRIGGATVTVVQQVTLTGRDWMPVAGVSTTTDGLGAFALVLPRAQAVMIDVAALDFQTRRFIHTIDYAHPTNPAQFALFPN